MAQHCRVCASEERERIDAALMAGTPIAEVWRDVAKAVEGFSESSLNRHARRHVGRTPLGAAAVATVHASDLTAGFMADIERLERIAQEAERTGAGNLSIRATGEARATRRDLFDRLGEDADELSRWLDEAHAVIREVIGAIRAAPVEAHAWGAALTAQGVHKGMAEDLHDIATAALNTPTMEK